MALFEVGLLGANKGTKIYLVYDDVTLKVSGVRCQGLAGKFLKVTHKKKGFTDFTRADFKDLIDSRGDPISDMDLTTKGFFLEKVPVILNGTIAEQQAFKKKYEADKGIPFPKERLIIGQNDEIIFDVDIEGMTRAEA